MPAAMGPSPPASGSPTAGSGQSSPKSAWVSPLPEASGSRSKPVFNLVDGVARVSVPAEIVDEGLPLWKCFVVGYFMGDAPHLGTIHATVNRIWASVGRASRIDVQFLSPKTVLFRIENEQTRSRVLRRKYWHIADIPLVVNEWSPETVHEKPSLSAMPLWVDFRNVPGFLFSQKGLRFLADITGDFVRLHPNTERCTRLDMARILVEVNLEKALTETICVEDKEGSEFMVSVSYPWLPSRCKQCLSWGHKEEECSKKASVNGGTEIPVDKEATCSQDVPSTPCGSGTSPPMDPLAVVAGLVSELENVSVGVKNAPSTVAVGVFANLEKETALILLVQGETESSTMTVGEIQETDQGWSMIPITNKSSPPLTISEKTESPMASPSRFHVLEDIPEEGEIVETVMDKSKLEKGSDMVNAQTEAVNNKSATKKVGKQRHQRRPILNKKDMIQVRPQSNSNKASSRKL